jgi:hypothetical protein
MTDARHQTKNTPPRPEPTTLERTRDAAADAARATTDAIEANPLGIVVGGLAVGALIGALLPRSDKERELLAPVGKRLNETARAAVDTAKAQGLAELESRGFTRDAAREQVKNVLGGLSAAAGKAGAAAGQAATGKAGTGTQDQA